MTRAEMEAENARVLADLQGKEAATSVLDEPRPMRKTQYQIEVEKEGARNLGVHELVMRKSADVPEDMREMHKDLIDTHDEFHFVKARFGKDKALEVLEKRIHGLKHADDPRLRKSLELSKGAMDTAEAGGGLEWVPAQPSAEFFAIYSAALVVPPLFGTPIKMTAQVIPFPTLTARPTLVAGSEQTADQGAKVTAVTPTTGARSFTAKKIHGRTPFSDELEEDAIFPWVPFYRQQLAIALARAEESAYLDGDTTNPHMDNDISAVGNDVRILFRGLRKHALANAATVDALGTTAGFTATLMRQARAALGADYALAPIADLAYICGAQVAQIRVLGLGNDIKPAGSHPLGLQYNPALPGEVARFDGIPVIGSPIARETLNAVGVHDLTTQNTGYVLCVYKPAWKKGVRKDANLRLYEDIIYEQKHLVISYRGAFDTFWTGEKTVSIIYNVKTTA